MIIVNVCSLDGTWGSGQSCLGAAAQFCQERNFDETRSASWAACCSILMFPILSYLEAALLLCVLKLRLNDNAAPTFCQNVFPFAAALSEKELGCDHISQSSLVHHPNVSYPQSLCANFHKTLTLTSNALLFIASPPSLVDVVYEPILTEMKQ